MKMDLAEAEGIISFIAKNGWEPADLDSIDNRRDGVTLALWDELQRIREDRPPTKVYALVINDRHVDTLVEVFTSRVAAIEAAQKVATEYGWRVGELTEGMRQDRWEFYATNPHESDNLHVVETDMR